MKKIITLTPKARDRLKELLQQRETGTALRVGIKTKGCSGLSYTLNYTKTREPLDEVVEEDGVAIHIEPKAILYICGSEMDFVKDKMSSGFVFVNPNEKGRCGCGKSFKV